MEIQERIKKFRKARGISTYKLSKLTGISQSTISKIENGKRKINFEILEIIAEALEISVDRLTGESVSSIIEDRLEEIGMTLEEVAEKTTALFLSHLSLLLLLIFFPKILLQGLYDDGGLFPVGLISLQAKPLVEADREVKGAFLDGV